MGETGAIGEPRNPSASELRQLAESVYLELNKVADYIWKAPRLLDHERKLEFSKLPRFANYPELMTIRWSLESEKLDRIFLYLIAAGSLFSAASLFEGYLLLFVRQVEKCSQTSIRNVPGQGPSKMFRFLKDRGIPYDSIPIYRQVDAALRVRNCMVHASGVLGWSRDEQELRRLCASGTYLSAEHFRRRA